MKLNYHKFRFGQDIILFFGFTLVLFLSLNCSTSKPFQLSDASPKFKEFQGSTLDPNKGKNPEINLTKNQTYDDFLLSANKNITSLEFAENVVLHADTKNAAKESIDTEMNAAGYLVQELPDIIAKLPSLQKQNLDLLESAPNDFDGSTLGRVSGDLESIKEKLTILIPKSEKIHKSIINLRADSENYSSAKDKKVTEEEVIQETKKDPIVLSDKLEIPENKPTTTETKIPPKPKSKVAITKIPKKNKVIGSTKDLFKEEIKAVEETYSDDEKKEIEYTEKIRKGLVDVFKWEYYRKPKNLEKILLGNPIPRVRSAAALALGRIKAGRGALQKAIDKDGYQVRPAAYKALADLGDKKSLAYFISGTKAEDIEVIAASYEGLGKTKDPAGREMIISDGLNSEYLIVVGASLRGLSYNKIPGDVALIEKFLKSSVEKEIKEAAIEALSNHGSREALRVLEENVKAQPEYALKILDEIGKNKSLSATFSLIRLTESLEDEILTKRIGEHLLRKKAFGRYALILVEDDFLRSEPNERSKPVSYIKAKEVGIVIKESKIEYSVRLGEEIITDKYMQLKIESTLPGSGNQYITGWVFYPKIEIIEVKSLSEAKENKYFNSKSKKHQNLFNPSEEIKSNIGSENP